MKFIAQNNGRYYVENLRKMRYFPIKKVEALALLAGGLAEEINYCPFSRIDLQVAAFESRIALQKIMSL